MKCPPIANEYPRACAAELSSISKRATEIRFMGSSQRVPFKLALIRCPDCDLSHANVRVTSVTETLGVHGYGRRQRKKPAEGDTDENALSRRRAVHGQHRRACRQRHVLCDRRTEDPHRRAEELLVAGLHQDHRRQRLQLQPEGLWLEEERR